jgi:hypothetical protein
MLKKSSWLAADRDSLMRHSQQGNRAMMGERLVMQDSLFYEFRLEDHVPSDHFLRRIDRLSSFVLMRRWTAFHFTKFPRGCRNARAPSTWESNSEQLRWGGNTFDRNITADVLYRIVYS